MNYLLSFLSLFLLMEKKQTTIWFNLLKYIKQEWIKSYFHIRITEFSTKVLQEKKQSEDVRILYDILCLLDHSRQTDE